MDKPILQLLFFVFIIFVNLATVRIKHWLSMNTIHKKGIRIPMIYIDMINYYVVAVFIVVLSASIGPWIIGHLTNMEITFPDEITASDATYYTLQALIAIVIGALLTNNGDKKTKN